MVLLPGCGCCGCDCPPSLSTCIYKMPVTAPATVGGKYSDCNDPNASWNSATSGGVTLSTISPYTYDTIDNPTLTESRGAYVISRGASQGYESSNFGTYGYKASFEMSAFLDCETDTETGSRSFLQHNMFLEVVRSTIYGAYDVPQCTGLQNAGSAVRVIRTAKKKQYMGSCLTMPSWHCSSLSDENKNKPYRFWPSDFGSWLDYSGTSFGAWDTNVRSYAYINGCYPVEVGKCDLIMNALQSAIPRLTFTVESRETCNPLP